MKIAYWILAALALALVLIGLFAFSLPMAEGVTLASVAEWYSQNAIYGAIIGGVIGAAMAALAPIFVKPRVREPATAQHGRVGILGIITAIVAAGLAWLMSASAASRHVEWPMSSSQRMTFVIDSGHFITVPAAALLAALVLYAIVTRARTWSGQHALLP